jgi:hypothetical protein
MRYHGTNGIMITDDSVYIKRDGRWICVYRDPVSVTEKASRTAPSVTTIRVARDRS